MTEIYDNFELKSRKSNFTRDSFSSIVEMRNYSEEYLPDMYEAFCYETHKRYRFDRNNEKDPVYGKWRVLIMSQSDVPTKMSELENDMSYVNSENFDELHAELTEDIEQAKKTANTAEQKAESKYTKPSSGIPESDLSESLKNKINNSDAINYKMNNTDPTGWGYFSLNRKPNTWTGNYSFTEGFDTEASGDYSHAEGYETKASASSSHTEGVSTEAAEKGAHSEGLFTQALSIAQHVEGINNVPDSEGKFLSIIGNGSIENEDSDVSSITPFNSHNASAVDRDGNQYLSGTLYVNGTNNDATGGVEVATKEDLKSAGMSAAEKEKLQCAYDDSQIVKQTLSELVPEQATPDNQLADKDFVNSSISTNTANFLGTYTSVDKFPTANVTPNDYVFLTDSLTKASYYSRYKWSKKDNDWIFEYTLNNSSFTEEQWKAINSGITADTVRIISDHTTYIQALESSLDNKVDKEDGKGLSTVDFTDSNYVHTDNNYTTTEKNKLSEIESGAQKNVQSDWNQTDSTKSDFIKNKPSIPNSVTESTVSGWGFTKNTGTYSKPSTGIPKTDLDSEVKGLLAKAESALQSETSLSKGTTSGTGNAVTDITVSGHKITMTKGLTFITSHQDISGKADKTSTVSSVAYDATNKKITKTINGTTSDVVSVSAMKTDMELNNVGNFKAVSTVAPQGLTDTEKSNARANIGAGTSSFDGKYTSLTSIPSSFTPSSHKHGNITNDGKIGTAANKPLITTTGGLVTTGAFGTGSGQFAEGNHNHDSTYVKQVSGKGLSTNDLTNDLKTMIESSTQVVEITQANYTAKKTAGTLDQSTFYLITDATGSDSTVINDSVKANDTTWSSNKINSALVDYAQGKRILFTEGKDLNTVVTIGEYYTNTDVLANSLVNRPSVSDGKLYGCSMTVHASTNGKIVQTLHTLNGDYTRYSSNTGTSWSNWEKVQLTSDVTGALANYPKKTDTNLIDNTNIINTQAKLDALTKDTVVVGANVIDTDVYWVTTYSSSTNNNRTQIAYGYRTNQIKIRYYNSNAWSSWVKLSSDWIFWNGATGNEPISLPTNWTEVCVYVDNGSNLGEPFIIPRYLMQIKQYYSNVCWSNTENKKISLTRIYFTNNTVKTYQCYVDDNDKLAGSKIYVLYKV